MLQLSAISEQSSDDHHCSNGYGKAVKAASDRQGTCYGAFTGYIYVIKKRQRSYDQWRFFLGNFNVSICCISRIFILYHNYYQMPDCRHRSF